MQGTQGVLGRPVPASPVVSDPLRLLDICATSDGAAALAVASADFATKHLGSLDGVPSVRAVTVIPRYPQHVPKLPDIATDSTAVVAAPERVSRTRSSTPRTRSRHRARGRRARGGVRTLSTALEPPHWYQHLGRGATGEAGDAAAKRGDDDRRPRAGEPVRWAGVPRRSDPRAGHPTGLRAELAAARPGGGPPGRRCQCRHHREPGRFGHGHPSPSPADAPPKLIAPVDPDRRICQLSGVGPLIPTRHAPAVVVPIEPAFSLADSAFPR